MLHLALRERSWITRENHVSKRNQYQRSEMDTRQKSFRRLIGPSASLDGMSTGRVSQHTVLEYISSVWQSKLYFF